MQPGDFVVIDGEAAAGIFDKQAGIAQGFAGRAVPGYVGLVDQALARGNLGRRKGRSITEPKCPRHKRRRTLAHGRLRPGDPARDGWQIQDL